MSINIRHNSQIIEKKLRISGFLSYQNIFIY